MPERDFELPDAETLAYQMSEAVADQEGDAAQEYLQRFLDELFQLEPGLRSYFSDLLLGELKEEVVRREDPKHSRAVVALVEDIEAAWEKEY
jgi:hypothetical protein